MRDLRSEIKAMDLDKLTVFEVYVTGRLRRFERLPDGRWYEWSLKRVFNTKMIRQYLKGARIDGFGLVM